MIENDLIEREGLKTFDEYLADFENQLNPQTDRWDDPIDQLAELFTSFLNDQGIEPKQITKWQTQFYKQLKDDAQLARRLIEKIYPNNSETNFNYFDPQFYLSSKIDRENERFIQPMPKPLPKPKPPTRLNKPKTATKN